MERVLVILLVGLPVLGGAGWIYRKKTDAPPVPFAHVKRETLVSLLHTNGKAEPLEWVAVRADTAGLVERLEVKEGQSIAQGKVLAELRATALPSQLSAAQTRVEQARAELATIARGGTTSELAEIENGLSSAKLDHEGAVREYADLRRLVAKQAV